MADLKTAIRYADITEGTSHYARVFAGVSKAMSAAKAKKKAAVEVAVPVNPEPVS